MQRLEQEARQAMRDAVTYAQRREAATAFGQFQGFDEWKREDTSDDYDWRLIRGRLREIRKLCRDGEVHGNVAILPKVSLGRYAKVTANPTVGDVERFIREGERAAWRRIEMVRNQMTVSQTLMLMLMRCLQRLVDNVHIASAA